MFVLAVSDEVVAIPTSEVAGLKRLEHVVSLKAFNLLNASF